jgi:hypothetical protein
MMTDAKLYMNLMANATSDTRGCCNSCSGADDHACRFGNRVAIMSASGSYCDLSGGVNDRAY